jgi:hypothetical protein
VTRQIAPGALVSLVLLATLAGGMATTSPQPKPVCAVRGETFHEDATGTEVALTMTVDGHVRWVDQSGAS